MNIASADPVAGRRHRLSVEDFHHMGEAGLFAPEARVELIEGEIIDMTPIGSAHASRVMRLADLLTTQLHAKAVVAVQSPVRLDDRSEPQPDLALLRYREDFYAAAHPGPADILLLIEVADTTARFDREVKIPLYARHGIPEVWLLDLEADAMRVYREPQSGAYREVSTQCNAALSPGAFPELAVDLETLIG
jgi:Uma2 family endonuclease